MTMELDTITIKLGSGRDIHGQCVWIDHDTGRACVKVEPGGQVVGDYVPYIAGLLDTEERDDE